MPESTSAAQFPSIGPPAPTWPKYNKPWIAEIEPELTKTPVVDAAPVSGFESFIQAALNRTAPLASEPQQPIAEPGSNGLGEILQRLGIQPPPETLKGSIYGKTGTKRFLSRPTAKALGSARVSALSVNGQNSATAQGGWNGQTGAICGVEYVAGNAYWAGWPSLKPGQSAEIIMNCIGPTGLAAIGARFDYQITEYVPQGEVFDESGQGFFWRCTKNSKYVGFDGKVKLDIPPFNLIWRDPNGRPFAIIAIFGQLMRGPIEVARMATSPESPWIVLTWA